MPIASATRLTWTSAANSDCGAPKPRKAPLGGVLVATARARDVHVRHVVRAAGMDGRPAQDDRRQRAVGAAVEDQVDLLGHDPAVAHGARAVPDDGRVPLGGGGQVLMAVVDHAHRSVDAPGEQGGMDGDERGVLLLAAESAAGLGLDDDRPAAVERERALERLVHVVRALQRPGHGHAAVLARDGDHGLVLDVELLLVTDPVGAFDDDLRLGEAGLQIALGHRVLGKDLGRGQRVEDGLQTLGPRVDASPRLAQRLAVGRRQQRQRLGLVPDGPSDRDEDGLVVADEADDVVAGDVLGGHDDDARPVEVGIEVEAVEPRMRVGGADGGAIPGAREDEVVGISGQTGQLLRPLATERQRRSLGRCPARPRRAAEARPVPRGARVRRVRAGS